MKIRPLADRVVIKKIEAEEKTASGIVLPGTAKEQPQMAEVIEVGPGGIVDGKEITMELKVGDKVKIIKTGNGSSFGTSNTAYGIGWEREILKIWEDRPYPYQVGNKTGTTGFYRIEALEKR